MKKTFCDICGVEDDEYDLLVLEVFENETSDDVNYYDINVEIRIVTRENAEKGLTAFEANAELCFKCYIDILEKMINEFKQRHGDTLENIKRRLYHEMHSNNRTDK